ncbi:MAG: hypothetical protein ACR2JN_12920 [Lapillicoccus sp.]
MVHVSGRRTLVARHRTESAGGAGSHRFLGRRGGDSDRRGSHDAEHAVPGHRGHAGAERDDTGCGPVEHAGAERDDTGCGPVEHTRAEREGHGSGHVEHTRAQREGHGSGHLEHTRSQEPDAGDHGPGHCSARRGHS